MSWGLGLIGYSVVANDFKKMIPSKTDVWEIGPNTDYDVYVEFGTYKMAARPYVRPGAERGMAAIKDLASGTDDINELLRLLALKIEAEIKHVIKEKNIIDTGNLLRSVEANKR